MAGLREIQGRIRSIEDTRKITGAMYMKTRFVLTRSTPN